MMTQSKPDVSERVFNFGAGPAALPLSVLETAKAEFLNYGGTGMSVMEIGHRTKVFEAVLHGAEARLRSLIGIGDDYEVLFLQGGARLQFAMIPMNLFIKGKPVDVLHTGAWSKQAIAEIKRVGDYRLAATTEKDNFLRLPAADEISLSKDASYVHLVANNTIFGTQWKSFPETGEVPLIADMTSDILSRPFEMSRFGLVFASAQKNLGIAGVTVVIIRRDLMERASDALPSMLQYRAHAEAASMLNTPPVFAIYMAGLVMDWVEKEGGLEALRKKNEQKARELYEAVDASPLFYCPVPKPDRSVMNVVFRVKGDREDVEKLFVTESAAAGLAGLKGHRSVGGLRASIYNAQPLEGVRALIAFMKEFEKKYAS